MSFLGLDYTALDWQGVIAWLVSWLGTGLALGGVGAVLASLVRRR